MAKKKKHETSLGNERKVEEKADVTHTISPNTQTQYNDAEIRSILDTFFQFLIENAPTDSPDPVKASNLREILLKLNKVVVAQGLEEGTAPYTPATFTPQTSLPPAPEVGVYQAFTTNIALSLRGAVWKVSLLGPYLIQRYELGLTTAPAARADPSRLGLFGNTPDTLPESTTPHTARCRWVDAAQYQELCERGPCDRYKLVRDDSFRTFRTADRETNEFMRAVPEAALVRVCSAFDHLYRADGWEYCQGMNVYAGVFLYVLPELDAFNLFALFCTQHIPLYWRSNHIGVEAGCRALDHVLQKVDPELTRHLVQTRPTPLTGLIIAFPAIKTMSATVPPLAEVLRLWDFLLSAGPYLSVLCVAAQIHHIRDRLLESEFPKDILDYRRWPPLDARATIATALRFLQELGPDVIRNVMLHPVSDRAVASLAGRSNYINNK